MYCYVTYNSDGIINSVSRQDEPRNDELDNILLPDGCSVLNISGQKEFDDMKILDIHNNYTVNVKTKKLVKRK
ncbi:MAG: hypothetical protein FWF98_04130 [Dehalococcoidia bacterium]|jgi:hypothetical protein|nr:hypothetical protein [Dehalococcoidia bacterium]